MKIGLFSGGKDSLTACHVMQDQLDGVLYCKTGIGLQENVDYVHDTCQDMGWKLHVVEPKKGETFEDFVRKFGFPHQGMHSAIMGYLKWHPMRKFARENKDTIFLSGRRPQESVRRMHKVKSPREEPEKNMVFESPLFTWSDKDVWDYIKQNELKRCPVYDTMHMSGDCLCGAFSELGESEMLTTFHPYMAKRIRELEEQYGNLHPANSHWGNQSSMTGASKQDKIVNFICNECIYSYDEKEKNAKKENEKIILFK